MALEHKGPARGPKGSAGTERFGSKQAPTSAWNSTVPQADAGSGDQPYPRERIFGAIKSGGAGGDTTLDALPNPGRGETFYSVRELSTVPIVGAGAGDMPIPEERSTVAREDAGRGGGGPRPVYPADSTSDAFMDYTGGDGGNYQYNQVAGEAPFEEYLDDPRYGQKCGRMSLRTRYARLFGDGYAPVTRSVDGPPPEVPVHKDHALEVEEYGAQDRGDHDNGQYPQPEDLYWTCDPDTTVIK